MVARLTESARDAALAELADWTYDADRDGIGRTIKFDDFVGAFGFMTSVAMLAERADHHPLWTNLYNRVDVFLTTHDCSGLSERDVALAKEIDALVA